MKKYCKDVNCPYLHYCKETNKDKEICDLYKSYVQRQKDKVSCVDCKE